MNATTLRTFHLRHRYRNVNYEGCVREVFTAVVLNSSL